MPIPTPLNTSSVLSSINTTFLVGDPLQELSSCSQLAFIAGIPESNNQTYSGWAANVTALQPLLQKVPADMRNISLAFLCSDVENIYTIKSNKENNGFLTTQYNMSETAKAAMTDDILSPSGVISNFTSRSWTGMTEGMHVGSILNAIMECDTSDTSIEWLYTGDNSHHHFNFTRGSNNSDFIEKLLQIPNAPQVSNLSITCSHTGKIWANTYGHSVQPHPNASTTTHTHVLTTLFLVSVCMLFVNGLFV